VSGLGSEVHLEDLERDPYPVLARLRREEPVAWAPALDRWLVSSRDRFLEVVMRPDDFTTDSERSPIKRVFGPQMLNADGDEQQRHRTPFAQPFRLRAVRERAGESVQQTVASLLDRVESGSPVDLGPLASELAVRTVVDMIGLIVDDVDRVRRWYDDFAAGLANVQGDAAVFDRARATAGRFREEMATSTAPGSLLDELLRSAGAGGGLGAGEVMSNALLVLFGGVETTESVILNAGWALLTAPDQLASVRSDPDRLPLAIEESMRWEPAVQTVTRFAVRDIDLGGARIDAGDVVDCMIGGANRDPAHFEEPDRFDVGRGNAADHVTFGHGRHLCLGLHLARLEAFTFWRALLDRYPSLALARRDPPIGHEFRRPPALLVGA
jgi:cytochrome P450